MKKSILIEELRQVHDKLADHSGYVKYDYKAIAKEKKSKIRSYIVFCQEILDKTQVVDMSESSDLIGQYNSGTITRTELGKQLLALVPMRPEVGDQTLEGFTVGDTVTRKMLKIQSEHQRKRREEEARVQHTITKLIPATEKASAKAKVYKMDEHNRKKFAIVNLSNLIKAL